MSSAPSAAHLGREMLEVRLIGAFEIRCNGKAVALSSRLAQSLFAYLILTAGTSHRREKLAGLFWPDSTDARARASLRHELWRIRQALNGSDARNLLHSDDIAIGIDASTDYRVDTRELERTAPDASIDDLITALTACSGELLPGFYEDWLVLERERLQALFEERIAHLLKLLEAGQRWPDMLEWAERWLALGQKPQGAYRALLLAYAALDDQVKLRASYERYREALTELGLEPSEEIRMLATVKRSPIGLPTPMTSFIGRERERKQVAELLFRSRLVTLTGSGGVGKTRLSIEVARHVTPRFPDGVWYLELASAEDPELVPSLLLSLLGIPGGAGETRSVTDVLGAYFSSRRVLVVLDNCEHLIEACARLAATLLSTCPGLSILATSLEALRVPGETPYRVPSMALPDLHEMLTVPALAGSNSVQLFVERAASRQSSFTLTPDNCTSVSQICMRLDGIPLAIELAAGRVGALNVDGILDHLNDRFSVLTGGSRTGLPRHQTLRALIDWSHELLSPAERVLFRRLAVFAGGWTLTAAQAIGAGGDIQDAEVLQLLPGLVEKSLVISDSDGRRYRMLETIRLYALERLKQAGEEIAVRTRHLDYFVDLASGVAPGCRGE